MTWSPPHESRCSRGIRRAGRQQAFTFIEIMMVVMIIGMLAAIVGPNLVGKMTGAKIRTTRIQLKAVENALIAYEMLSGDFPSTEQGLKALAERPSDVPEDKWEKQMKSIPPDAWGRPFVYRCPGENGKDFDLFSVGKDGKESTDDDIFVEPTAKDSAGK